MALRIRGEGFRFLFRTDKGVVNREVWWLGTALIGAVVAVTTAIWLTIAPMASTDLARRGLVDPTALSVYLYLIVYAFVALIAGVCWYNLSAKRFRDLGREPSLAGLPLVAALFSGALHWVQPRMPDVIPGWTTMALDIGLLVVILWTVYELGVQRGARHPNV
ncbi:MAG: hypothetical protein K2X62_09100 [Beijerinckiaceae bacterium]|jgi:uncharacterized membrane protein YhaH (DUF805 family)|nr:hypothetical protein [Beijerinckiaceae bacterium]